MFEELLEEYKKLSIDSKKEKNIEEFKLVIAMLELLCDRKNIKYNKVAIDELVDLKNDNEYLSLIYTYITALKEEIGSYILDSEKRDD